MTAAWYARPVLFVADMDRTLDFYVNKLGFAKAWRYEDGGGAVAEARRDGAILIFSSQWPEKAGKGLMFVSLNVEAPKQTLAAETAKALDGLRAEFERRGAKVEDGHWGYRLLVVRDPDGNELYFNYPN